MYLYCLYTNYVRFVFEFNKDLLRIFQVHLIKWFKAILFKPAHLIHINSKL